MIDIIRRVTGLIARRFNECTLITYPPKDGVYKNVLTTKNQMDDSLISEFKNIPSVKIEYKKIEPNKRKFEHQYIIFCDDKKMKFL